jgi:hypothetical protein
MFKKWSFIIMEFLNAGPSMYISFELLTSAQNRLFNQTIIINEKDSSF